MNIFELIVNLLLWLLLAYLAASGIYVFVFALAGLFRRKQTYLGGNFRRIAVMIPSYKEDEVIVDVALKATQQLYPKASYDVVVIADSLKKQTLNSLSALPVNLIQVSFEKSTKAKALNNALNQIETTYDIALVLDADNIMEADFLRKINSAFGNGSKVVQGKRVAKNNNTSFAVLDGISEAINNHIFRQGHRALGLSSGLIGSGMAFDYHLFKNLMKEIHAVGGFDKELEFRLFQAGHKIEYLKEAQVYDEKIQSAGDFNKQRRRWLSTNQVYFKKFLLPGLRAFFFKGNLDIMDKLLQMIIPPRVLLLGAVGVLSVFWALLDVLDIRLDWMLPLVYWYLLALITILTFAISIPRSYYNKTTLRACISLPRAFAIMFLLLFRLKGANKEFIHTRHHVATKS